MVHKWYRQHDQQPTWTMSKPSCRSCRCSRETGRRAVQHTLRVRCVMRKLKPPRRHSVDGLRLRWLTGQIPGRAGPFPLALVPAQGEAYRCYIKVPSTPSPQRCRGRTRTKLALPCAELFTSPCRSTCRVLLLTHIALYAPGRCCQRNAYASAHEAIESASSSGIFPTRHLEAVQSCGESEHDPAV